MLTFTISAFNSYITAIGGVIGGDTAGGACSGGAGGTSGVGGISGGVGWVGAGTVGGIKMPVKLLLLFIVSLLIVELLANYPPLLSLLFNTNILYFFPLNPIMGSQSIVANPQYNRYTHHK